MKKFCVAVIVASWSACVASSALAWSLSWPPVSVVYRSSILGQGKVAIVTNTSDSHLHECSVKIVSPGGKSWGPQVFALTLEPHKDTEIGWVQLENWTLESGEEVSIGCKGYALWSTTIVPK